MDADRASRTAVLVCEGRAVAHGRLAVGRFDDPTAMSLLLDEERAAVEAARDPAPPRGWVERMTYERLRATAEVMAARTVAIDDAVRARPAPQVVILGAGLDGRAWRMRELAASRVLEVDQPASQRDKLARLGALPTVAQEVRFVPVDFARDDLDAALAAAEHRPSEQTTWIWEGVVAYLSADAVAATVSVLSRRSAPGSRLVVSYQTRSLATTLGRLAARAAARLARSDDPTAHEPWRSFWTVRAWHELLATHGLAVREDEDLLSIARRLGLEGRNRRSLAAGRVAVADVR